MQRLTHQTRYFDGFTLDLTRGCLVRGAQEIKLRPKPFEALKYLVENSGRLISKAELIQVLWPETAVTDDSLDRTRDCPKKLAGPVLKNSKSQTT